MDRTTTVLLQNLEEQHSAETQDIPLSTLKQLSKKDKRAHSSTSILRRSISDSVERNLCHRVGLHQVINYTTFKKNVFIEKICSIRRE